MIKNLKYLVVLFMLLSSVVSLFGQNYILNNSLNNSTVSTCSGNFYDSGGASSNYSNNQNRTVTFCSNISGEAIFLNFFQFNLQSGWDVMYIYDGPNTSSPLIGAYSGTNINSIIWAASGCITIKHNIHYTIKKFNAVYLMC